MTGLRGPTGLMVPDGSLELADLPPAPAPDVLLISGVDNKYVAAQPAFALDGSFVLDNDGKIVYF